MSTTATSPVKAGSPGQGQMPGHRVLTYSFGDIANNLSFMMTSMFLMVYMTDIVGLSAGVAGAIYGITKIWAGFADLIAGNTVDRTNSRWGRLRPYLLFGPAPLAIVFVALFSTPANMSMTMTIAWIFIFDALYQLAYSFINIPYGSLASSMTQDPVDRSKLSGSRAIASALASVALAWVVSPQFQDTTADGIRLKFTITCIILAVIAVVLYLICFANSREVVPRAAGSISFKQTFTMLKQNRPLQVLLLVALLFLTSNFVFNAVGLYYVRSITGNAGYFVFLQLAQTAGTILFASFAPTITRRYGKRSGYMLAALLAAVGYGLIFFIPGGTLMLALVAWFFVGLGVGGSNAMMFSMQADTVDYGEWVSGIRSEGGSYSILSFTRKIGQGIGGWVGGAVIGAYGYVAGAEIVDGDQISLGLRVATGAVPAVLAVIALAAAFFYRLDGDTHLKVVDELTKRRTQSSIASAKGVDAERTKVGAADLGDGRTTLMRKPGLPNPPIVTLFGQRGSGATDIGPLVAELLGVKYIDQKFSSRELAQVDKTTLLSDSTFDRFLRGLSGAGGQGTELGAAMESASNREMASTNTSEVLADVEDGGVILGRNGALVLGPVVGTLHVRLVAPMDKRIERVMHKAGLSASAAAEQCEIEDRLRAEMSLKLYKWDPNDDEEYDLTINTASITYKQVAELIAELYRSKYPDSVTPSR